MKRGGGGHHGIYSDTAQVQSRVVRWTGGGGRICDFPIMSKTCYTVGFVCVYVYGNSL